MALSTNDIIDVFKLNNRKIDENYVHNEDGKGLSSNDYSNEDKEKLNSINQSEMVSSVNNHTDSEISALQTAVNNHTDSEISALQTAVNGHINTKTQSILDDILNKKSELIAAINALGGNSIDVEQLKSDILNGVEEIIRPSGHQYPNVNIYPDFMCPRLNIKDNNNDYTISGEDFMGCLDSVETADGWSQDTIYVIEHLDVSRFQSLYRLFEDCFTTTDNMELDLSGWDVSNVKSFRYLFARGYSKVLKKLNMSNWDTRKLKDMYDMFADNYSYPFKILELDISGWNVSNLQNMDYAFYNLKTPVIDLSTWDLSYVSSFDSTFEGTTNSAGANYEVVKVLWGGSCNASLDLSITHITPENAELFFQSLDAKMTNNEVTITMPSTAQGADVSIATAKGYIISGIS